jgi:hypothetical protein
MQVAATVLIENAAQIPFELTEMITAFNMHHGKPSQMATGIPEGSLSYPIRSKSHLSFK